MNTVDVDRKFEELVNDLEFLYGASVAPATVGDDEKARLSEVRDDAYSALAELQAYGVVQREAANAQNGVCILVRDLPHGRTFTLVGQGLDEETEGQLAGRLSSVVEAVIGQETLQAGVQKRALAMILQRAGEGINLALDMEDEAQAANWLSELASRMSEGSMQALLNLLDIDASSVAPFQDSEEVDSKEESE